MKRIGDKFQIKWEDLYDIITLVLEKEQTPLSYWQFPTHQVADKLATGISAGIRCFAKTKRSSSLTNKLCTALCGAECDRFRNSNLCYNNSWYCSITPMYKPRELLRLSPSCSRESSVASAASAQSAVSGFSAATSARCYDETDKEGDVDAFAWFDDDDVDAWHDECHSTNTTPMRAAKALCDVDVTTPAKDVQLPDVPAGRFKRAIKNNENGDLKPTEVFAAPHFTTGPMSKRQKQEARANAKAAAKAKPKPRATPKSKPKATPQPRNLDKSWETLPLDEVKLRRAYSGNQRAYMVGKVYSFDDKPHYICEV